MEWKWLSGTKRSCVSPRSFFLLRLGSLVVAVRAERCNASFCIMRPDRENMPPLGGGDLAFLTISISRLACVIASR